MQEIRVRFAPSPTGYLHIGSLRTVLFDYLMAKSLAGKLILRIEDTDQKREVKGAIEKLIEILDWLGIKFDEGPHLGGKFGPYIQSQRLKIYQKYAAWLVKKNAAYLCFCSEARLKELRENQQAHKLPPKYDRYCRDLTNKHIAANLKAGKKYVIRQRMPLIGEVLVKDELRGEIKFNAVDLEDHVLLKSDGIPTYQLAVVVDDHLMQISHVLRGDEWLPSFPKNILLYQAFGWQPPKFIHLPLILNKAGGKLSKRQGDVAVEDYQGKGYLPEALLNFCLLQGWHPKEEKETLTLAEMIEKFDHHNLGVSPAIFDLEKLDYFNGHYIRQKPIEELTRLCLPFLVKAGYIEEIQSFPTVAGQFPNKFKSIITGEEIDFEFLKKIVGLEQERMKKLSEVGELTEFFFKGKLTYEADLLIWKNTPKEQIKKNLEQIYELLEKIPEQNWTDDSISDSINSFLQAKNLKVGDYLWPMRVALTGREGSPGPFEVAEALGKEKSLKRIVEAANYLIIVK